MTAGVAAAGILAESVASATDEKQVAAGEANVKRLLLLMDKDKNGKVSKKEFMDFMEAEFDRLDTNKSGDLDVQELTKLLVKPHGSPHR